MAKSVERQVRFNSFRSERNRQMVEWYFLIVNDNRGIKEALTRIGTAFSNLPEEYTGLEGTIKGTGLRYKLVHFDSSRGPRDLYKVYGKMRRDSGLYERQTESAGLLKYIVSIFGEE
jgi:hypothetical protein